MSKVHIHITNKDREKEADTKISEKLQEAYKKKCEEKGIEYKFLEDNPKVYRGIGV